MIYFLIIVIGLLSFTGLAASAEAVKLTGTFSSFEYNEEGGDLIGTELRIVLTSHGYQGTIQMAEGSPGELVKISPIFDGLNISFEIKDELYQGQFKGSYTDHGIEGVIYYVGGGESSECLPRKVGHWDSVKQKRGNSSVFIANWRFQYDRSSEGYNTTSLIDNKSNSHDKQFLQSYKMAVQGLSIPPNLTGSIGEVLWLRASNAFLVLPVDRFPKSKLITSEQDYRQCEDDHAWLVIGDDRRWLPVALNPFCQDYDYNYFISFYHFDDVSAPFVEIAQNGPACTTYLLYDGNHPLKDLKEIGRRCE